MARKPQYGEPTLQVTVRLPLSTIAYYKKMGNGKIAVGIVSVERQLTEAEARGKAKYLAAAAAGESVIDVSKFLTAETPPQLPYLPYLAGRDTARVMVLSLRPENRGVAMRDAHGQVFVDGMLVAHAERDAGVRAEKKEGEG